jgi:hypothetical protein
MSTLVRSRYDEWYDCVCYRERWRGSAFLYSESSRPMQELKAGQLDVLRE